MEKDGAGLEELLTFHCGSSTTDTPGRAVAVIQRPPVNLTVLDLLVQTEGLLSFWASEVLVCGGDGVVGPVPEGSRLLLLGCSGVWMWRMVCRGVR